MRALTDEDFDRLKRAPAVQAGLAGIEAKRQAAARRFWIVLPIGALILAGQFWFFWQRDLAIAGVAILLIGGIATWVIANWGLMSVNDALKDGILGESARVTELRYARDIDSHPVMEEAQAFLFSMQGTPRITDLFEGELEGNRKLAFFEMGLSHETGTDDNKKTVTDFAGQMFAIERTAPGSGVVAVRPRSGGVLGSILSGMASVEFPGFKATARMVELGDDPAFESDFEVMASDVDQARAILTPEIRSLLSELRAIERTYFYCGPRYMLVGLWGGNKFESGNLLGKTPLEQRCRTMCDDLNASIATMQRVIAVAG